jgi:hypothetical protein
MCLNLNRAIKKFKSRCRYAAYAGQTDMRMGREVFPFEELQEAMIQVKKGLLKDPNAVIKLST